SNGISRFRGSSLRTIFPSRSGVGSFPIIAVQLKRKSPQLQVGDHCLNQRATPTTKKALAIIVVPGSAQKLNLLKSDGSPTKKTPPATIIAMERIVLTGEQASTSDTRISL